LFCDLEGKQLNTRTSAGFRLYVSFHANEKHHPSEHNILETVIESIKSVGGNIRSVDEQKDFEYEMHVDASGIEHQDKIKENFKNIEGITIDSIVDGVEEIHKGGKIDVISRTTLNDGDDLAMAYTPGVGRICTMIEEDESRVWDLTGRKNAVAVLSNGTAVLGLGDIGPEAAMPVMEGKAVLFREFAGIAAYPICVNATTADELVAIAKALEPTFGGINLEDIAAPVCFEAEDRMRKELSIPVFHDDQHGTAIVTLAALFNACKVVKKDFKKLRVVMLGAGAAGVAVAKLLLEAGVEDVIVCDRKGMLSIDRSDLKDEKLYLAENGNVNNLSGTITEALSGADVFMGVSGPNLITSEMLEVMSEDAIVFAMANPVPEIMPELVPDNVAIVATGRSDYPNQINNVLVFPGFFRGLLDAGANNVTEEMKLAAAFALAEVLDESELGTENIIASPFNKDVVNVVSKAVFDIASKQS
jgi:malate dehydrogenase (oxaloacetate-decarboxylating)